MTLVSGKVTAMLEVEGLVAWYGGAKALHGLSFAVAAGEAVVLLGRNGAGKSTALKAIIGLEVRRQGRIRFAGNDISSWPTHRIAQAGLGFVAEDRRIFGGLTVSENLAVARLPPREGRSWELTDIWNLFPPLQAIRDRRGGYLSGGEQQMLAIGRTLMGNPRFLLLDEPSEGLAPVILDRIGDAVAALKARGLGLLVAEQSVEFARGLADRALMLETGELRFAGTMAELDADPGLLVRYLAV
ncbi:MAG: ABC transporter ATP-binding protein [Hyphomicrobiaceae bacterium]|nr:ABC transporter ATP-binding protein [Hyphomicrobiaceae bacterium]